MIVHKTTDRRDYYRKVYLKSEHWKFVREMMLKLFPECQVCGSRNLLDVHHRVYRSLYDVKRKDLIVLCRCHHLEIHALDSIGRKPTKKQVETRLVGLLEKSPRSRYLKLAVRFLSVSAKIEKAHGIEIKSRARRILFRGKMDEVRAGQNKMLIQWLMTDKPPNFQASKTVKVTRKLKSRKKTGLFVTERFRYNRVAIRLFTIARKIKRVHGINILPHARKMIFSHIKSPCQKQLVLP